MMCCSSASGPAVSMSVRRVSVAHDNKYMNSVLWAVSRINTWTSVRTRTRKNRSGAAASAVHARGSLSIAPRPSVWIISIRATVQADTLTVIITLREQHIAVFSIGLTSRRQRHPLGFRLAHQAALRGRGPSPPCRVPRDVAAPRGPVRTCARGAQPPTATSSTPAWLIGIRGTMQASTCSPSPCARASSR